MPIKIIEFAREFGIGEEFTRAESDKVYKFLTDYTRAVRAIYPGEVIEITFHKAHEEGPHRVEIEMKSPWVNEVMKQSMVTQVLAVRAEVIRAGVGE